VFLRFRQWGTTIWRTVVKRRTFLDVRLRWEEAAGFVVWRWGWIRTKKAR
jgi:hypothetical protein